MFTHHRLLFQHALLSLAMFFLACSMALATPLQASDTLGLSQGGFAQKREVIEILAQSDDPKTIQILQALHAGKAYANSEHPLLIQETQGYIDPFKEDPFNAKIVSTENNSLKPIVLNNNLRRLLQAAIAQFDLVAPELSTRQKAVENLLRQPAQAPLHLVQSAITQESDQGLKEQLRLLEAFALVQLVQNTGSVTKASSTPFSSTAEQGKHEHISHAEPTFNNHPQISTEQLSIAVERIADSNHTQALSTLNQLGSTINPESTLGQAIAHGIEQIEKKQAYAKLANNLFSGLSLGSILLLAALGLAVIYGLIGVINMAHGEFLMLGAYATYLTQNFFRAYLPQYQDYYLLMALPTAFVLTALIGLLIEWLIIRHLYGRPLESLLATFGLSLVMMQAVRIIFGAQNVEVANPSWLSGSFAPFSQSLPDFIVPYNRLIILGFSLCVVLVLYLLINRTRLGLFIRAVTQNRGMASCVGIKTRKIDAYAFALGAGIAGLGGVALSQIGNVGPDLGQAYIIDSFMAVVLGGVGQLIGTVIGAFGLGIISKLGEPLVGAVLIKIIILLMIIVFIQKRPQGLFALKGRSAEA